MVALKYTILYAAWILNSNVSAFSTTGPSAFLSTRQESQVRPRHFMTTERKTETNDVVELSDDTDDSAPVEQKQVAPFISQGEIDPDAMNPNLSDAKEARVIIYMIISLLPVLFLIPLMIGSRDLIPADWLPPVDMGN